MEDPHAPSGTVTKLLRRTREGDVAARDELFARVEGELRRQAQAMLAKRNIRRGVIQGTDLVNIACQHLIARDQLDGEDRAQFFFLLGRKMADVLAELARAADAAKRGGGVEHMALIELPGSASPRRVDVLELRECVAALREVDAQCANVLELHVMAGRTLAQTAEMLGMTLHEVRQEVAYGLAFMRDKFAVKSAHEA